MSDTMSAQEQFALSDSAFELGKFKPNPTITIHSNDGRIAVIDYGGDEVTFSGDLPIEDAARQFFECLGGHLQKAYNESRRND